MLLKLTIFLPLFGFLLSGISSRICKKDFADKFAQYLSTAFLLGSAVCSGLIFADVYLNKTSQIIPLMSWINSGTLSVNWSIKLDSLTAVMLVVVTWVSSLVHIYSTGYMHDDKSIARFMSYLSLFTFFMLMLVSADNFLQLFFGWEGVGVASYLLIGFWFHKQSANAAAIKAFLVNRVGDFGLIIGIALIYKLFGTIEYAKVFAVTAEHLNNKTKFFGYEIATIDLICIALFIGAMGKSAQIFLHTWLADAMEGPTPVSALIHAATMVTAGVFLVARCSPLFEHSQIALMMVTIVGASTAIFAATIALTQNDIKRIIAYSTCSQLGYMFFACGVSAYSAGIFHLFTHAFFKALLFLGAGSVIHAMHHEQDIQVMRSVKGDNWKKIPITCVLMWIGSLALAGIPPFAGFYSKDAILEAAFMSDGVLGKVVYILGATAAFLTAFYSWRLIFIVFHGKKTTKNHINEHNHEKHHGDHKIHESPISMLIPLFVLGIGSIVAGFLGANIFSFLSFENNFFADAIFVAEPRAEILERIHHTPFIIKNLTIILGIIAIIMAYVFYVKKPTIPTKLAKSLQSLYKLSFNKWYFDELYEMIFVGPLKKLGDLFWKIFDVKIIDGIPNGLARLTQLMSGQISKLQTGYLYHYSLWMILGLLSIITFLFLSIKTIIGM